MTTYHDIANTVTWSQQQKETPIWLTANKRSFMFVGQHAEDDFLFLSICRFLQCKKTTKPSQKINFCIVFTNNELQFFQTGKSNTVEKILFCPSFDLMRANGGFKKTLWQYMGNLGMI